MDKAFKMPIGEEEVRKAASILQKYKQGKQNLESKIINNEKWWKMRHWDLMKDESTKDDPKPASGWLFNTIMSKHAEYMDCFPAPNILPREPGDVAEAQRLSSIIPVILEQNAYRKTYSDEVWYKLKNGTGVYGIFWDTSKLNGLGDVSVKSMDLLTLFWEPGVTDIQDSENFFSVELVNNSVLTKRYPDLSEKLTKMPGDIVKKYCYDDTVDTTDKSAVIDWYYKKYDGKKQILHYVKFVGDTVLYATENDIVPVGDGQEAPSETGLYDHGLYPFVFDPLFPEAGMPVGFGFVDVCKNAQASIDIYNNVFEKNLQYACAPRYFERSDGGINEEELRDPNKMIVHVDRNLGDDSIRPVQPPNLISGNYITILNEKIDEMKETAGNRDTSNGSTTAGVTAASAIAAMQEAAGKTSRDQISASYDAYKKVVTFVIELIRQFYTIPRQFRITGEQGQQEFTQYTNSGLIPEEQGSDFDVDLGTRLPVFDIKVNAERESSYSKLSQNELALNFYAKGFFNPELADQALACVDMMNFEGKERMVQKIQQNGGMYQQMMQMQQQMLQMAQMLDQLTGQNMSQQFAGEITTADPGRMAGGEVHLTGGGDSNVTANARQNAAEATRPL